MSQDDGMTRHGLMGDVCRCHDSSCKMRYSCLRYLDRKNGHDWTPHMATMRQHPNYCASFLEDRQRRYE